MLVKSSLTYVDNSLEHLLKLINDRVFFLSATELDNMRFNLDNKINYSIVEDLLVYKDIITQKILGCNCICIPTDIIASRIKKLVKIKC